MDAVAEDVVFRDMADEREERAAVGADEERLCVADELGEEAEKIERSQRDKRCDGPRVSAEAPPARCCVLCHPYLPDEKVMRGSISM